jgi:hypothetical protein
VAAMTFQEIEKSYYSAPDQSARDAVFRSWDFPTRMAWRIVQEFNDMDGFKSWWIWSGEEIQDHIFYVIKNIVNGKTVC